MKRQVAALLLLAGFLCGCQNADAKNTSTLPEPTPPPSVSASATPALTTSAPTAPAPTTPAPTEPERTVPPFSPTNEPSGVLMQQNESAAIDYSHTESGYVMARYTAETDRRIKAQVKGPETTYTFNLTPGQWAAFPLTQGDGRYQVSIYQNVQSSKYALVLSASIDVALADEFAPFLHSNQFVNYDQAPQTVALAAQLCQNAQGLEKVALVYEFVVAQMVYDTQLAASVKSGYVPALDQVLAKRSGICFDYAALMTGMLRSQGVPCKLVVGYAGQSYHAWISVWSQESGWIEGFLFFDGSHWHRMDPTFASSAQGDPTILDYIQDDSHYTAKYIY